MSLTSREVQEIIDKLISVNDRKSGPPTAKLTEDCIIRILTTSRLIFSSQPAMLELNPPLQVCGDIHGQFSDLLRLFSKIGWPNQKRFLFLGDYVDRGPQQIETILLLIAYKIAHPLNFFLLRGNHECAQINRVYGFYDEVKRRYSVRLWLLFQDLFNMLPLTALIGSRILCMHGGISPYMFYDKFSWNVLRNIAVGPSVGLAQKTRFIRNFNSYRPLEVKDKGMLTDILWSDPENITGWRANKRGISYAFGADVVEEFCESMDVDLIARAHQVVQDGYEFFANRKLVTVFSAPRYCGEFDNSAASMSVDDNMVCTFKILMPRKQGVQVIPKEQIDLRKKRKNGQLIRSSR